MINWALFNPRNIVVILIAFVIASWVFHRFIKPSL